MKRFGKRLWILAALAVGLSLGGSQARADILVTLAMSVGGNSATETWDFTTNTLFAGPTLVGAVGTFTPSTSPGQSILTFSGSFGGNLSVVANSTSSNSPGGPVATLGVSSTMLNNSDGAQVLTVMSTATSYTMPVPAASYNDSASLTVQSGTSSVTFDSTAGPAANVGPHAVIATVTGPNSSSSNPPSTAALGLTAPFTMTGTLVVSLGAGAQVTSAGGNATLTAPEPSTISAALFGVGLVGLVSVRRNRRNRA